jgi:hypothetical protein
MKLTQDQEFDDEFGYFPRDTEQFTKDPVIQSNNLFCLWVACFHVRALCLQTGFMSVHIKSSVFGICWHFVMVATSQAEPMITPSFGN